MRDHPAGHAPGVESPILRLQPIGVIHSPHKSPGDVPRQSRDRDETCQIEVFDEFSAGLQDIDGFSHIVIIYWLHKSQGYQLLAKPPGEESLHGVFATRSPRRPCPLGLTVAELVVRKTNIMIVRGLDAVDGTPLLDIKPFLPDVDDMASVKVGWLEGKSGGK